MLTENKDQTPAGSGEVSVSSCSSVQKLENLSANKLLYLPHSYNGAFKETFL